MNILKYLQNALKALGGENSGKKKEKSEEAEAQSGAESEFEATLEEFDMPTLPDYEELTREDVTDEELTDKAAAKLSGYKESGQAGIDEKYGSESGKLEEEKSAAAAALERTLNELQDAYRQKSENLDNDTVKAGLSRSSIKEGASEELRRDRADVRETAAGKYGEAAEAVSQKLDKLKAERERALDLLDTQYAAKLEDEIDALQKQRDAAAAAAVKYNNTLAQRRFNDRVKYAKAFESLSGDRKAELSNALYLTAESYLGGLGRGDAYKQLTTDPAFKKYLTAEQYRRLASRFG